MGIAVIVTAILGVAVFYIWKRAFKKSLMTNFVKYFVIITLTVCSAILIFVASVAIFLTISEYYPDRKFDSEGWKQRKDERYEYSKDIIESKILIGKSKDQIRKLLGDENNPDSTNTWGYNLGFKPEIANIDADWLDIEFKNGRVINVSQHQE